MPVSHGYVTIFYNFIRKHQASGIGLELGHDKWLGLIRKAQSKDEKDVRENKRLQQLKNDWKRKGWING